MAKKQKLPADTNSKEELEERKKFYKMLLASTMSLEEKQDELWDLPNEDKKPGCEPGSMHFDLSVLFSLDSLSSALSFSF